MDPKSSQSSSRTRRPAYRDSREEKAVRVYTINQESRYILVKGVPRISNITEEVLKPFSLYGHIQEYRILDDYPDIEEFTTVYWIRYVDIQSARVAKRKMNNKSFFGGFLKVVYAPEYEDIEDTRQKLIGRRKDVARRLRQLGKTGSQDVSHLPGQKFAPEAEQPEKSTLEEVCLSSSPGPPSTVDRAGPTMDEGATSQAIFPTLPLPPVVLPQAEWKIPPSREADSSIPCVPSAHATLPRDFNPYLDDDGPSTDKIRHTENSNNHRQTPATGVARNVTGSNFWGRGKSYSSSHDPTRTIRHGQNILPSSKTSYQRPNGRTDSSGASTSLFQRAKPLDRDLPSSSPWVVTGRRELDRQPEGGAVGRLPKGGRPKVVPRRRFAWTGEKRRTNPVLPEDQQFLGQRQNPAPLPARNPGGELPGPQYLSRQVQRGLKRRAEADLPAASGESDAAPSSFDQSVNNIRERMRQVHNPATASTGSQSLQGPQTTALSSRMPMSSGQNQPTNSSEPSEHTTWRSTAHGDGAIPVSSRNQRQADPSKRRRI